MKKLLVERGRYFDSVFLLRISRSLEELPGVRRAVVAMGTPANLENLARVGFDVTTLSALPGNAPGVAFPQAGPRAGLRADDLVIAVEACGEAHAHQHSKTQLSSKVHNTAIFVYPYRILYRLCFAAMLFLFVTGPLAVRALAEHAAEKGAEGGEEHGVPELTNILIMLYHYFGKPSEGIFFLLHEHMNVVFFMAIALFIIVLAFFGTRNLKKIPTGFQAFLEFVVTALEGFFMNIIGPKGRPYIPLCGTIFIFILLMNLAGVVPLAKSPIALNVNVPLSLALVVFLFVHYHGIRQNGIVGYVKHYLEPLPWYMAPIIILLAVIHIIGEIAKPITLTFRLFGNITAEDIVIAVLVILGAGMFVPLQLLFFPLGLLFSFIQALIFSTLTAVYIALMMSHDAHHEESH